MSLKRKLISVGILGAICLSLIGIFLFPLMMEETSKPEFCGSCHVMDDEYQSWFQSGSHARILCVDCHLPHDNFVNYLTWKGLDGTKDVILFYSGMVSTHIDATSHARKTIQANCLRCHGDMVMRLSASEQPCWHCHRSKFHFKNH